MCQHQTQLLMVHDNLGSLPALLTPKGYHIRSLLPGDETAWERIIEASFGGEHHFHKEMASDEAYKAERVWFVSDEEGLAIATASAWQRPQWNEETGYLHMVGLMPEHTGKGLGYIVSLAALLHMVREGKSRAVLNTDDFRIPAIKTYLKLGFVPELAGSDHLARWTEISANINRSFTVVDSEGFRTVIPT